MTITNFNPDLWAAAVQSNLNKAHVYAARFNRKYEGQLKASGESVKINSIGRITAKSYTKNAGAGGTAASPTIAGIDRPEVLQGSGMWLVPDQMKYINFEIDDVDRYQQVPDLMSEATREAAYALEDATDLFAGSTLQSGVAGTTDGTGNRLAAKTSVGTGPGDDDAYEILVDLFVKLSENDVPRSIDHWVVVPPWFYGMLQKDVRFTNYGTDKNRSTLANGIIGEAAGFTIYESNNISGTTAGTLAVAGGAYTIIAGIMDAATFAETLTETKAFEPQDSFNDAIKMLHVYGAKVTRPYALASVAVTQA